MFRFVSFRFFFFFFPHRFSLALRCLHLGQLDRPCFIGVSPFQEQQTGAASFVASTAALSESVAAGATRSAALADDASAALKVTEHPSVNTRRAVVNMRVQYQAFYQTCTYCSGIDWWLGHRPSVCLSTGW